jgi:hypothetical protein
VTRIINHNERIKDCALNAICGELLGRGQYRCVYALDDKRVLKVEDRGDAFCNPHEWAIWCDCPEQWQKWFAPCLSIDDFGIALIQRRTKPLTEKQWASLTEIPDFMADIKRENWGWLDGRPVCHDYGNHAFLSNSFRRGRMVKRPTDRD